jgi:hypothetical protein
VWGIFLIDMKNSFIFKYLLVILTIIVL